MITDRSDREAQRRRVGVRRTPFKPSAPSARRRFHQSAPMQNSALAHAGRRHIAVADLDIGATRDAPAPTHRARRDSVPTAADGAPASAAQARRPRRRQPPQPAQNPSSGSQAATPKLADLGLTKTQSSR